MIYIVRPEVLTTSGHDGPAVTAFFTGRDPGIDVEGLVNNPIYFPRQEHTADVMVFNGDFSERAVDAVITSMPHVMLGIKVADCVPVLLYDPLNHAVAAVHAGWRGTAGGILKNTITLMSAEFGTRAADLLMAVGPSIRSCCYEVGREVADAVMSATGDGNYIVQSGGSLYLDLQEANRMQALSEGLKAANVEVIRDCTCCGGTDRFNSWRCNSGCAARQGAFIGLGLEARPIA